tara:strand:+ start:2237 stop:3175 length:939 start_codon:yes stop_codon:yes gene_type:complete
MEYQKAIYLELDNYKAPKGINPILIPMNDGKKIRLFYWKKENQSKVRGTILLQQGHNEFIEKYYETIREFLDRDYDVISFDWRGQGLSERMIKNKNKQYIEDFKIHEEDLIYIYEKFISNNFQKPIIGVGHSMGGCILLSSLKSYQNIFDKVLLSAPMLGFRNEKFLLPFIEIAFLIFNKESYLLGSKPNMGVETPFEENDLTSDYNRYSRTQNLVRLKPDIRLWGVTNAWSKAVKKRFLYIREKNWAEKIDTEILFINSTEDKVVSSEHIQNFAKRFKNSKIINFENCKHEIFMEKDQYRSLLWKELDNFL